MKRTEVRVLRLHESLRLTWYQMLTILRNAVIKATSRVCYAASVSTTVTIHIVKINNHSVNL